MAFGARQSRPLAGTARVENVERGEKCSRKNARILKHFQPHAASYITTQTRRDFGACKQAEGPVAPGALPPLALVHFCGESWFFLKVAVDLHKERKPTRGRMLRSADVGNGDNYAD